MSLLSLLDQIFETSICRDDQDIVCRFVGAQSLAANSTGNGEASTAEPTADLDPEIALHLRRLSKREAVTKMKALQVLSRPSQHHILVDLKICCTTLHARLSGCINKHEIGYLIRCFCHFTRLCIDWGFAGSERPHSINQCQRSRSDTPQLDAPLPEAGNG